MNTKLQAALAGVLALASLVGANAAVEAMPIAATGASVPAATALVSCCMGEGKGYGYGWRRPYYGGGGWGWRRPFYGYGGYGGYGYGWRRPYWGWRRW